MGDHGLEDFFLRHSVLREKDDDEIGPNARPTNSDSEASDDEAPQAASAHDKHSGWQKKELEKLTGARMPRNGGGSRSGQTGAKGVLRDHGEAKREQRREAALQALQRDEALRRIASELRQNCSRTRTLGKFTTRSWSDTAALAESALAWREAVRDVDAASTRTSIGDGKAHHAVESRLVSRLG